jgi:hypothetical protein
MDATSQTTTSAHATRLRLGVPRFAGMPAWSGNGDSIVVDGGSMPSRGIAGAGEQGVGIRVFATGGDV